MIPEILPILQILDFCVRLVSIAATAKSDRRHPKPETEPVLFRLR